MSRKTKKRTYRQSGISAEQFVELWQKSPNLPTFCHATGLEPERASSRAIFYKSKGIPLKKFPRGGGGSGRKALDVAALKKLAKAASK